VSRCRRRDAARGRRRLLMAASLFEDLRATGLHRWGGGFAGRGDAGFEKKKRENDSYWIVFCCSGMREDCGAEEQKPDWLGQLRFTTDHGQSCYLPRGLS
jgi:hypothetical protein